MDFELRTRYWGDHKSKAAFKRFILDIHGLDFAAWDDAGFWDEAFTPFSFFDGGELVANVCVYLLDAIIEGRATKLGQISSVGTSPELRRRGLNRRLTDIALDWAKHRQEGIFLFSDAEATPFYERCGFEPLDEFIEETPASATNLRPGVRKLDPGKAEDLAKIHGYANRRAPISDRFSIWNPQLTMFHVQYFLGNLIHEIPDLNCLVAFRRSEGRLGVFDIVAKSIPKWNELYPFIADPGDRTIEFHFHTDRLEVEGVQAKPLRDNLLFALGVFPVKKPVFPYTSRA